MKPNPSRACQAASFTISEEKAAHRIAAGLSKILGTYIDPYTLNIWPARGYWTHNHQDCQRWTGTFPRPDLPRLNYSIGSWSLTASRIAGGCKMTVYDERDNAKRDNDFQVEP